MKKRIAVLTSSRADYGIYHSLLKLLKSSTGYSLEIIAFGTHLSEKFGKTIDEILGDGFTVNHRIDTLPGADDPRSISSSMAVTLEKFAHLWAQEKFDLIFALGDRYEMFAAVSSAVPFNIPVAHFHGGETTLGSIDNAFRNAITCMCAYHFTCAEPYRNRVVQITGSATHVYNVGALSIDNLKLLNILSAEQFRVKYNIDLTLPSVLVTFHPETVDFEKNRIYIDELVRALNEMKNYQLIISMPNADTMGLMIRERLSRFIENSGNAVGIESFGMQGYLSCMNYCRFMLGNSSSGFVEAAFFKKKVINLGNRQTGRIMTPNILNCPVEHEAILVKVSEIESLQVEDFEPVYGTGYTAEKILEIMGKVL